MIRIQGTCSDLLHGCCKAKREMLIRNFIDSMAHLITQNIALDFIKPY